MNYLSCKNMTLGYEGEVVTTGLDFEVNSGDYLCIIGENGAGKSTLIKALVGLIKPVSGETIISDNISRSEIGYLPQHTEVQRDFPASVEEIVLTGTITGRKGKFFYGPNEKKLAFKNMENMGIMDIRKKSYRDLSGGQQQRVLLARALCATNKLLILDEPVTGLDPKVTCEFYKLLARLNQSGVTIVMVSHDLEETIGHAKQILHIGREQIFFGEKEDYLNTEAWHTFHEHHVLHCHHEEEECH